MLEFEKDILQLIYLSAEIAKYSQIAAHCVDPKDKRNFNLEKADDIILKIQEMRKVFIRLLEKYNLLYGYYNSTLRK